MLYIFRNRQDKKAYKRALSMIEENRKKDKKHVEEDSHDEDFHESYIPKKHEEPVSRKDVKKVEKIEPQEVKYALKQRDYVTPVKPGSMKSSGVRRAATEVVDMHSYKKEDAKPSISSSPSSLFGPRDGGRSSMEREGRRSPFDDLLKSRGIDRFDDKHDTEPPVPPKKDITDNEPKKHFMINESGAEDGVENKNTGYKNFDSMFDAAKSSVEKKDSNIFDIDKYLDEQLKILEERRKKRMSEQKRDGAVVKGPMEYSVKPERPVGDVNLDFGYVMDSKDVPESSQKTTSNTQTKVDSEKKTPIILKSSGTIVRNVATIHGPRRVVIDADGKTTKILDKTDNDKKENTKPIITKDAHITKIDADNGKIFESKRISTKKPEPKPVVKASTPKKPASKVTSQKSKTKKKRIDADLLDD